MSPSEAEAIETELSPPFEVARPASLKVPLVFNSPHSGRVYPRAFLAASRLDSLTLRRSEDASCSARPPIQLLARTAPSKRPTTTEAGRPFPDTSPSTTATLPSSTEKTS